MGSGKTSAIINKMFSVTNHNEKFIFITPFLSEIERIIKHNDEMCQFKQPFNNGSGKLEDLHKLLANGENIATTHALFLKATDETIQLIHEGGYILILDEVLDVLHNFNEVVPKDKRITYKKSAKDEDGDFEWLINNGYIKSDENYNVQWHGPATSNFHYSEVKRLAENNTLRCIDNVLFWEYPQEVFKAFSEIYVLTYLFEGSILDKYFQMYNLHYKKVSSEKVGHSFQLCSYSDDLKIRQQFANLINIYEGNLNDIGNKKSAFSVSWLKSANKDRLNKIKKVIRNYRDSVKAKSSEIMWTTIKQNRIDEKLSNVKGFRFTKQLTAKDKKLSEKELNKLRCFVPCNARATNDFADRTVLLYLINRFLNPEVKKYFAKRGFPLDEDQFATSEMIQWIWRSAIRKGKPIHLFVPSSRMRGLLYNWLGVQPSRRTDPVRIAS